MILAAITNSTAYKGPVIETGQLTVGDAGVLSSPVQFVANAGAVTVHAQGLQLDPTVDDTIEVPLVVENGASYRVSWNFVVFVTGDTYQISVSDGGITINAALISVGAGNLQGSFDFTATNTNLKMLFGSASTDSWVTAAPTVVKL